MRLPILLRDLQQAHLPGFCLSTWQVVPKMGQIIVEGVNIKVSASLLILRLPGA